MDSKDTSLEWKEKAVARSKQIKELNKRIKEKEQSRDNWKMKYTQQRAETLKYKNEIEIIKKKIEKILVS
jgi:peptidoglycan hydrolase CwlO-like protein